MLIKRVLSLYYHLRIAARHNPEIMITTTVASLIKNTRNKADVIDFMTYDIVHLLSEKKAMNKAFAYIRNLAKKDQALADFATQVFFEARDFKRGFGDTRELGARLTAELDNYEWA